MDTITLYKKDNKGQLRIWSITAEDDGLQMEFGVEGGEMIEKFELIEEGKGGRDQDEQIYSRLNSRVEGKRKRGYVADRQQALEMTKSLNLLGYSRAMLAARYDQVRGMIDYNGALGQYKFDGHRCMVVNDGGELIAYSRNGKIISSISHILDGINIPEGVTIDGELYVHGLSLQKIGSLVKREQADTIKLRYYVYDLVNENPYRLRYAELMNYDLGPNALVAETFPIEHDGDVAALYAEARKNGYEGAMIRTQSYYSKKDKKWIETGYEDKRSKTLIKVKSNITGDDEDRIDDEFLVVDIIPSKDGWARLVLTTREGRRFKVSAPGTLLKRYEVYRNRSSYIGRAVTVEFSGFTEDKIPFHPVATGWREKEAE